MRACVSNPPPGLLPRMSVNTWPSWNAVSPALPVDDPPQAAVARAVVAASATAASHSLLLRVLRFIFMPFRRREASGEQPLGQRDPEVVLEGVVNEGCG